VMISRLASEVEADLAGRPALLRDACSRALAYLSGLGDRPVAPAAADVAALNRLDFALPGAGQDAASVLALLDDYGSPGPVASGGPRYFGFVTGGASSQRARGAEMWAVLATLGRDGVAALVDRTCALARRFAEGMRAAGYTVASDVVLNQVVVDFGDEARTSAVIAAVQE